MNALSELKKQIVYIHSPFALLASNMALSDIFIQLFHWVFFSHKKQQKTDPFETSKK